jgi:ABC-type uncharacterized transport system permease subunit
VSIRALVPYLNLIRAYARAERANARRIAVAVTLSVVRVSLIAAIYRVAYHSIKVSALSYPNAIWSIAIYFAFIMNLGLRAIFVIVNREVHSGDIEVALLKPLDWRLSKICELLGKNGLEFIIQLIVMPVVLLLLVGPPDISHLTPVLGLDFVVLTALSIITASALFLTIGLSAFWLSDAQSLNRIIDKVILIFGGGFVPIALLPVAAQLFVRYTPFGVYAAPTQLFNPGIVAHIVPTMIAALFWSVALVALCQHVWNAAQRRIEVNGG